MDCCAYNIMTLVLYLYDAVTLTAKLHSNGRYSCGQTAEVNGDLFTYTGILKVNEQNPGIIKILEPMSSALNYYEYEIVSRGKKCAIGIGVGDFDHALNRMPGWEHNGVGYHADDGYLFNEGDGKRFGPLCSAGDRMGCGVDFQSEVSSGSVNVFFTKNGQQVGDLVRIKKPTRGLYPLVGMDSEGEQVRYLGHWHHLPQDSGQQTTSSNGELLHIGSVPLGVAISTTGNCTTL